MDTFPSLYHISSNSHSSRSLHVDTYRLLIIDSELYSRQRRPSSPWWTPWCQYVEYCLDECQRQVSHIGIVVGGKLSGSVRYPRKWWQQRCPTPSRGNSWVLPCPESKSECVIHTIPWSSRRNSKSVSSTESNSWLICTRSRTNAAYHLFNGVSYDFQLYFYVQMQYSKLGIIRSSLITTLRCLFMQSAVHIAFLTNDASHAEYCGFLMNMEAILDTRIHTIIIGARNRHVTCQ